MKKYFITSALLSSILMIAQVGVNTASPKTTMDISAKRNDSGSITDNSQTYGLQAPRLSRAELTLSNASYGADQKGALIYITDISGGDMLATRIYIDTAGYYYFDGTYWQKIAYGNNDINIYKDNGTLTSDRVVMMNSKQLTFQGNGNIGIGTGSPSQKLEVDGIAKINQKLMVGTTWTGGGALSVRNNVSTENIASFVDSNNTFKAVLQDNGNFGIGTNMPSETLDVNGNIRDRNINNLVGAYADKLVVADATGVLKIAGGAPFSTAIKVFDAGGGPTFKYGSGWQDNAYTTVPLGIVSDPLNKYDTANSTYTIATDGLYYIEAILNLTLSSSGLFNGDGGEFRMRVEVDGLGIIRNNQRVIRGAKITSYDNGYTTTGNATVWLKAGQTVRVRTYTAGAPNMTDNASTTGNLEIKLANSYMRIYKLF